MSSRRNADQLAGLLRAIADRLELDPNFLDQLMPTRTAAASSQSSDFADGLDLTSRYHEAGPDRFRDWLGEQSFEALQSFVVAGRFDTTGKVRRWKEKERVLDFLYREVQRRAKFGRTILPAAPPFAGSGSTSEGLTAVQEPDKSDGD